MIALGYMLKKVVPPPDWLMKAFGDRPNPIEAVYALSNCVSADFADYIHLWKHNGWWLFDNPDILRAAAVEEGVDPAPLTLFYYEAYEEEYDAGTWRAIAPEASFTTAVRIPVRKTLCGYDVVTFWAGTSPECSQLSCCCLASETQVNRFCLFDRFEDARDFAQSPLCEEGEPGPYRVIAVYRPELDQ
ncbi:MAG TPA: hypothetical protein VJ476_15055 [Rhizomicrobium sp.]|nr:hypothetical protein [Rhizomicrobium sp.]